MEKGLLMVFTGDGKGKTTAALGLAMRAAGHGLKTCSFNSSRTAGNTALWVHQFAIGRLDIMVS